MSKIIIFFILFPIICYLGICILMYIMQDSLLFFPVSRDADQYKKLAQNQQFKNLTLTTSDGIVLDGWEQIIPDASKVILYFGGNAEETSYFVENSTISGARILSFNYRGYGRSGGKTSEKYLFSDAVMIYDSLVNDKKISPQNIIIMGRSLGTGVATYLASQRHTGGVILITPYDSIESVASENYGWIPVSFLLKHKFLSTEYTQRKSNPLLCIYGGRDIVIPNHHTENLLAVWNGKVDRVFVPDANHNDIFTFPEADDAIQNFISSH